MNKREELLQSALELFSENGYENVGIQKIADSCAVGKPTLYHYFGNKNGFLKELINVYANPFLEQLENAARYNGDLTLTLETVIKEYFRFAAESKVFYRLYMSLAYAPEGSETFQTIQPVVERQFLIIEKIFASAVPQHGNMRGRSKRYAFTFMGIVNAYITTAWYGQTALSDETAYLACGQFMHGIMS